MRMLYSPPRYDVISVTSEPVLTHEQVRTEWDWPDVHRADQYLEQLEALVARNASSAE
jgi:hypothetical protein